MLHTARQRVSILQILFSSPGDRAEKYGFKDWDVLLAAIGHGGLKEGQVVNPLAEEYPKDTDR